jgi:hypothetical protein
MRVFSILAVLVLSLALFAGCRKPPELYGNFAKVESADLVQDTLAVLLSAYLPAKTRLNLIQPVEDMFGLRLVESLRGNGYAVGEYAAPGKSQKPPAIADAPPGMEFGYVLDRVQGGGELRVTLSIGNETISRLYAVNGLEGDATYIPVGFWMRRREEDDHGGQ